MIKYFYSAPNKPFNYEKIKLFLSVSQILPVHFSDFIFFFSLLLNGQNEMTCGNTEQEIVELDPALLHHCFDVEEIIAACEEGTMVYLKVNIHFFLNDDCSGTISPTGDNTMTVQGQTISLTDNAVAYELAEDMINRANEHLEGNRNQWNSPEPDIEHCVPFRWLLNDIIFHCDDVKQTGVNLWGVDDLNAQFGVNTDSEFNVYLITHNDASGEADGAPGHSATCNHLGRGLFNHEMGHVLGLRHSWRPDGINDTPEGFDFDLNCDGTISSLEMDIQCWESCDDQNSYPSGPPGWDYDGDGNDDFSNACEAGPPCADEHPCCDWSNQNNNIMAYSKYVDCCGAFTAGQIERMMNWLSTDEYCEYIEYIGDGCPPPMPNIEILPTVSMTENCSFCFYIGASMHDDWYQLEFFDPASGSMTPIHTTGWIQGAAPNRYCISSNLKYPNQYKNGFQANKTYTAILTVENFCGNEKSKELSFSLPPLNCNPHVPNIPLDVILSPTPNPHQNSFDFEYELLEQGDISIQLVNALNQSSAITVSAQNDLIPGRYAHTVSTQSLPYGVYALILRFNEEIYSVTVLKQAP